MAMCTLSDGKPQFQSLDGEVVFKVGLLVLFEIGVDSLKLEVVRFAETPIAPKDGSLLPQQLGAVLERHSILPPVAAGDPVAAPARETVAAPAMPERREETLLIRGVKTVLNKANEEFSLFPGKCVDDPNSDDEVDEDEYATNALETELAAVLQQFKKKGTRGKAQGKAKPQGKKNKREFFWEKVSKTKKRKAPAPLDPPLAKVVPPAAKVVPPSTEVAPPSAEVDQAVVVPTPAEVVPPPHSDRSSRGRSAPRRKRSSRGRSAPRRGPSAPCSGRCNVREGRLDICALSPIRLHCLQGRPLQCALPLSGAFCREALEVPHGQADHHRASTGWASSRLARAVA